MAVQYSDLEKRMVGGHETAFHKKTGVGYKTPQELSTAMGITPERLQWGQVKPATPPPAPPATPAAGTTGGAYTVQPKDTLWKIASKSGMTLQSLLAMNPQYQQNPDLIRPGETVNLSPPQVAPPVAPTTPATPVAPQDKFANPWTTPKPAQVAPPPAPPAPPAPPIQQPVATAQAPAQATTAEVAPAQAQPTPRVVPQIDPETEKAYEAANKTYQESLKISPEELSTQADIDRLIESTKKGYEGTRGQAIPMEFITGQMAAIERRATGLAEPLERKMARLQAQRLSSSGASKFALEQAEKKLTGEQKSVAQKIEDIESARRFDVTTGLKLGEQVEEARQFDIKTDLEHQKVLESARQFDIGTEIELEQLIEEARQFEIGTAEKARQFDIGTELGQAKLVLQQQANERAYNLSVQKFNEDKRQYGIDHALKERNLALTASKIAAENARDEADGQVDPQKALTQIDLMKNSLAAANRLSGASGRSGLRKTIEGTLFGATEYTELEAETNTIRTNILTMMTDPAIKKFFGPQMSEADVKLMTAAGTTLNPELQGPESLRSELTRLDDLVARAEQAVYDGMTGTTSDIRSDAFAGDVDAELIDDILLEMPFYDTREKLIAKFIQEYPEKTPEEISKKVYELIDDNNNMRL